MNGALQGFTHREIALIALLVQFHRKGDVNAGSLRALLQPDDEQRVLRLAALLRIAEYLERRKCQVVQDITVDISDPVRMTARTIGDAAVEIWDANRASRLFRKAYGRDVEIR